MGFAALFAHGLVYAIIMLGIFRLRKHLGLGVLFCLIGSMHFLETYLAATFFIDLPFGLISPGSTVMFAGKLSLFLLLYIKEDAEVMRQPVYGLLAGNVLMLILGAILRLHSNTVEMPGYNPDLIFVDQMGFLMMWGTILLFIDAIMLIIIYERLGGFISRTLFGRIFVSLALVLSFDQVFFYLGLHYLAGVPQAAFYGGWIAKIGVAAFFTAALAFYLRVCEPSVVGTPTRQIADVFDRLTYRHRYENLMRQVGKDPLTGLRDRGLFEQLGPTIFASSVRDATPMSAIMIDIDRFKSINDNYGHIVGDRVIQNVAQTISNTIRDDDYLFRYGGEEFALICNKGAVEALALAERIRAAVIADHVLEGGAAVSISAGISTRTVCDTDFTTVLSRADAALYQAKARGRNCVEGL
ncbi:hypothetical protein NT2_01_05050 [Caenibius tardaugens NBRC 16725]|uniref:diguanylate cyclase n=1 Tax=Caenibius tardaugens NBRC 16725 TaxID=1219035 RepID=U2Y3Y0_9SPHN|nr:GGDEF domain-containing protein [Caenibius tardaugens]AZI37041.1 GGDEF domain-containing protein [Caenibius tardaugens NBRC 16725]GAD47731.1 hypothetical protein NT2_01_05050 [Caenibius tardaugens NBRC 16725]